MKLALIQSHQNELYNFPGKQRFSFNKVMNLRNSMTASVISMIETAAQNGADLIVTTEAFNFSGPFSQVDYPYKEFYSHTIRPEEDACASIAKTYHTCILAGLIRREYDDNLYNSTVFFDSTGTIRDIYHKIHLAGDENAVFTAGTNLHTLDTEFGRLGFAICWDMQFPETARELARKGSDLILCPTWGWEWIYGPARAYENGIFTAAAMAVPYWGPIEGLRSPSQVITPEGVIAAHGSRFHSEVVYCILPDIHCADTRNFRLATPLASSFF